MNHNANYAMTRNIKPASTVNKEKGFVTASVSRKYTIFVAFQQPFYVDADAVGQGQRFIPGPCGVHFQSGGLILILLFNKLNETHPLKYHTSSSNEVIKLALFPLIELIMFTTLSMITFQ